jgi:hypothetical protein
MSRGVRLTMFFAAIAWFVPSLLAQAAPAASGTGHSFGGYIGFTQTHDGSGYWMSELDSATQFSLGHGFSFRSGVPLYLGRPVDLSGTTQTSTTSPTASTSRFTGFGDPYVAFDYALSGDVLTYKASLTGTIPVADSHLGISTGRVTFDQTNRFSHDFGLLELIGEAGFGNSSMNSPELNGGVRRHQQPFITLGPESHFRGGVDVPAGKRVSFDASIYDVLPFGTQKLYSSVVPGQKNGGGSSSGNGGRGQHNRVFELAHQTTGNSSLTSDHGFSSGISVNPRPHVDVSFNYDRSVKFALNTVSFGIGYRFGDTRATTSR